MRAGWVAFRMWWRRTPGDGGRMPRRLSAVL